MFRRPCVMDENNKICTGENHCLGQSCDRLSVKENELLTPLEKGVVDKLGEIHNDLKTIIKAGGDRQNDISEMVHAVHQLQRMVMSQAAARHYPELFRELGK